VVDSAATNQHHEAAFASLPTSANNMMTLHIPKRKIVAVFCAGTAVLATAMPAWAWGRIGHRVISRFAEQRLTDKAKAVIAALLPQGESLADASLWADEHRRELPKTAPWR
jgi:hypothetical protein